MALTIRLHVDDRPARVRNGLTPTADAAEFDRAMRRIRIRLTSGLPGSSWRREHQTLVGRMDAAAAATELPDLAQLLRATAYDGLGPRLAAVTPVNVHLRRGRRTDSAFAAVGTPTDIQEVYELG